MSKNLDLEWFHLRLLIYRHSELEGRLLTGVMSFVAVLWVVLQPRQQEGVVLPHGGTPQVHGAPLVISWGHKPSTLYSRQLHLSPITSHHDSLLLPPSFPALLSASSLLSSYLFTTLHQIIIEITLILF